MGSTMSESADPDSRDGTRSAGDSESDKGVSMLDEDFREIYEDLILDHQQDPRNFGPMANPTHRADGFNRSCGDRIQLSLKIEADCIQEVKFTGSGCAISTASASLMTEALQGKTRAEAEILGRRFRDLLLGDASGDEQSVTAPVDLGDLQFLSGVKQFPIRVKCATLCWHTLEAALNRKVDGAISTE
jgi:nitrogen fixation NifU-like protein